MGSSLSETGEMETMLDERQRSTGRVRCMTCGRGVVLVAIAMFLLPLVADATGTYAVVYERNVAVVMRDGVTLRADIFRPDAADKFPVLLQRTPYDKNYGTEFGLKAAAQGYVVIIEDVRGRFASEGEWYPFKNESND